MSIVGILSPLDYAILTASDVGAKLVNRISLMQAHFEMHTLIPDGSRMVIQLIVEVSKGEYLKVREMSPLVLPASCPPRHINSDGTFCLAWSEVQDMRVLDRQSSSLWWNVVYAYLIKQQRVNNSRRWPGEQWAHGHKAAANQWVAEEAAKSLGEDFIADVKLGKFRVEKINSSKRPSSLLKMFRNNAHIYSVWENFKKLTNSKAPCLCKSCGDGKPKAIRSCGSHGQSLVRLCIHLYNKELEEGKFIKNYASFKACCGTLDECPIKSISGIIAPE